MNGSYRPGLLVVAGALLLAAGLRVVLFGVSPATPRAGLDISAHPIPLGSFRLTERSGGTVTQNDMADRVWIASFIFTRCRASCPKITAKMNDIQIRMIRTGVRLVSISVDPEHDTPQVLAAYAQQYQADPNKWWFLTGPKGDVYRLILEQFKVPVSATTVDDQKEGAEAVSHSARLVLVDRGNKVVGYFDSDSPSEVRLLMARARHLDAAKSPWVRRLPTVNALLNGSSAVLLLVGWFLIRTGRKRGHAACMISAVLVSFAFLCFYLAYHIYPFGMGSVPYQGGGPARTLYFTILLSHTALAAAVVPLVAITLTRALRGRYKEHQQIARVTFPIWVYVSLTGVVVYLMLYH